MSTSIRSSNFSRAELNILLTSLEANRELALGEVSGTPEDRKKEWTILADLINSVGGQNRTFQHVRSKWSDMKSRTKKKFVELKTQKVKPDGKPIELTDLEKRILRLIRPDSGSFSATLSPDVLTQYESTYETKLAISHLKKPTQSDALDELNESSNQPDDSVNSLTFPIESCLSDDDQQPSTSQVERHASDQETESPFKQKLKLGSKKSLHFRINCHSNKKGSLLHDKINNAIKTRNNINSTLTDIKSLLQESVKLQKQMLENQKLELMLLAKIADAELLYDD